MGRPHFIFGLAMSVSITGGGLGCCCCNRIGGATIECLNWKAMGLCVFVDELFFTLFDVFLCTRLNIKIYIKA
jgi:hypothetical protein